MVWVVARFSGAIGEVGPAMLSLTRLCFLCSSLMRYNTVCMALRRYESSPLRRVWILGEGSLARSLARMLNCRCSNIFSN